MEFGNKMYSVKESYWIIYNAFRTAGYMLRARKSKELSPESIERIMLAVTEVNGCGICAYAHTKMALEAGISDIEIQKILAGDIDDIPAQEFSAVMFAQHYADTRGKPSQKSWQRIVEIYGPTKAKGILGSIRAIMFGNAYGIAWIAFSGRLKGKADPRSNLAYETAMFISCFVFIPVALINSAISALFRVPIISFKEDRSSVS